MGEIFSDLEKKKTKFIELDQNKENLKALNSSMGLALNEYEISYLTNGYERLKKDASDTELMMFSQINSEHCRHKIINSTWKTKQIIRIQKI